MSGLDMSYSLNVTTCLHIPVMLGASNTPFLPPKKLDLTPSQYAEKFPLGYGRKLDPRRWRTHLLTKLELPAGCRFGRITPGWAKFCPDYETYNHEQDGGKLNDSITIWGLKHSDYEILNYVPLLTSRRLLQINIKGTWPLEVHA